MMFSDFSFWIQEDLQVVMELRDNQYVIQHSLNDAFLIERYRNCRRIHFRTISTNETHPDSASPYIDLLKSDYPVWENCNSVSYEDRIACGFWEMRGATRLGAGLVLDAKKSKVIMVGFNVDSTPVFITDSNNSHIS
jgi:hypothetical protein